MSPFRGARPAMARPVRAARAFTLVELMMVLVIMAMLSAMIVPSMSVALRGKGAIGTSRKMKDMLHFGYISAVSRRRAVVFHLDTERRRCRVTLKKASLPWHEDETETRTEILAEMQWPRGTDVTFNRYETETLTTAPENVETLTFRSDGTTDDAEIILRDEGGKGSRIEVLGATGEITAEEEFE